MKKDYVRTTLYLSPDTLQKLRWIAKQQDRSPSYVVRQWITQIYDELGGPTLDDADEEPSLVA